MPDRSPVGKTIEHYRIDKLLGQGGMAAVYQAIDLRSQRDVALKFMHAHLASQESFRKKFLDEISAVARLNHPNIVKVLEYQQTDDDLFMVMEFLSGGTLRAYIKRLSEKGQLLELPEAIEFTRQLADALDYAHRQGMIHRDIKPDNVVLRPATKSVTFLDNQPVLTDFGLARLTAGDENADTDQPAGTYPYMSPEHALGDRTDNRSDIYSLGILLYELAAGRLPYMPHNIAEAARMHGKDPLTPPSALRPEIPASLEQIILKALEKDPLRRYQTAEALMLALQNLNPRRMYQELHGTLMAFESEASTDTMATADMTEPLPLDPPAGIAMPATDDFSVGKLRLVFFSQDHPAFAILLPQAKETEVVSLTIGTAEDQQVQLVGEKVSRRHARLDVLPNHQYLIADLGSTNGTWLDDTRLSGGDSQVLAIGQVFRIGDYWARLEIAEQPVVETISEEAAAPIIAPVIMPDIDIEQAPSEIIAEDVMDDDLPAAEAPTTPKLPQILEPTEKIPVQPAPAPAAPKPPQILEPTEKIPVQPAPPARAATPPAVAATPTPGKTPLTAKPAYQRSTPPRPGSPLIPGKGKPLVPAKPGDPPPSQTTAEQPQPPAPEKPASNLPVSSSNIQQMLSILDSDESASPADKGDSQSRSARPAAQLAAKPASPAKPAPGAKSVLSDTERRRAAAKPDAIEKTFMGDSDLEIPPPAAGTAGTGAPQQSGGKAAAAAEPPKEAAPAAQEKKSDDPLVGRTISHYNLTRLMGRGPVSAVYDATETRSKRQVALRMLYPTLAINEVIRDRFREEARICQTLDHPNIARVIGFEQIENYFFMVMEFITGGSMRGYMRRLRTDGKSIEYSEIIDFTRQLADALHYAHGQGLIHRDIKPDNIVMRETPSSSGDGSLIRQPILTDFGLAQAAEVGEQFGTDQANVDFSYMSPEETEGRRIDVRSDVYELGTVMYELVTGQPPYTPRSMGEAVRMHTRDPLAKPSLLRPGMPLDLERVIVRCLEKDPNNRYQNAAELSRALQNILSNLQPAGAGAVGLDAMKTVAMSEQLPSQMPMYTPQPVTDDQVGYDRIVVYSEKFPTLAIRLDRKVISLGRGDEQMLKLDSPRVSRRHARIEKGLGDAYRIVDLNSTNGTWLGTTRMMPGVAEVWSTDKTVRIGDYWLRLEQNVQKSIQPTFRQPPGVAVPHGMPMPAAPGMPAVAPRSSAPQPMVYGQFIPATAAPLLTNVDDPDAISTDLQARQAAKDTTPPPKLKPAEQDKIGLSVPIKVVTVAPGSSITLSLEVHNQSERVDHFKVEVNGLPQEWYTVLSAPLYLLPNNRETTSITFHPPLASSSSAGAHAFEIHVSASAQMQRDQSGNEVKTRDGKLIKLKAVAEQGTLIIQPFQGFTALLDPTRARGKMRPEVTITNTGNTHTSYMIEARDREQMLLLEMSGKQYRLAPGQSDYASIRIKPRGRPFLGVERSYPFEAVVTPLDSKVPPQTLTGDYTVKPRFPIWILSFLILAIVLCALLSLFLFSQYNALLAQTQTVTAQAVTATFQTALAQTPVVATEIALSDPDSDGLSNIREGQLGTDPNNADTDADGLNDGEEVRIWGTDPLKRDTDGDSLTDGTEVNVLGTDPLRPDTDGDGKPDNEDETPTSASTPTPTAFPTIVGSNGDICPGSPPTRLQIGVTARVEPGGVSNRLRDNPGISAGQQIGQMPPESRFRVIGGPVCDAEQQLRWWQVDYNGVIGWTAEGVGEEYYIGPLDGDGGGGGSASGGGGGATTGDVVAAPSGDVAPNPDVVAAIDAAIANSPQITSVGLDRSRMGAQLYMDAGWQTALNQTGDLGVGWIKIQVNWEQMQPDAPGQVSSEMETLENNLRAADARGYKILLGIAKAPRWSRSVIDQGGPPDRPQVLADFLTLLLTRTGGIVDAIEIWNEPNLKFEWNGILPFTGEGYMQLFLPAYNAIKATAPNVKIVVAGLAPTTDTAGSIDDRKFFRQMYAAGLGGLSDVVVGIHPYGWGNAPESSCCNLIEGRGWDDNRRFFFRDTLADYRTIMLENNHPVPLWITEFGWATWADLPGEAPEPWMTYTTLIDQANHTIRAFQMGQKLDFVGPMILWNLNFGNQQTVNSRNSFAAYSLFIEGVGMRPVFGSLVPR